MCFDRRFIFYQQFHYTRSEPRQCTRLWKPLQGCSLTLCLLACTHGQTIARGTHKHTHKVGHLDVWRWAQLVYLCVCMCVCVCVHLCVLCSVLSCSSLCPHGPGESLVIRLAVSHLAPNSNSIARPEVRCTYTHVSHAHRYMLHEAWGRSSRRCRMAMAFDWEHEGWRL